MNPRRARGAARARALRDDPLLDALDVLERAVEENVARSQVLLERIRYVRGERKAGGGYREIIEAEERPGMIELTSATLDALKEAGSVLRGATAQALHDEGMTMDQIAELYGVSRQRVSALLRRPGA